MAIRSASEAAWQAELVLRSGCLGRGKEAKSSLARLSHDSRDAHEHEPTMGKKQDTKQNSRTRAPRGRRPPGPSDVPAMLSVKKIPSTEINAAEQTPKHNINQCGYNHCNAKIRVSNQLPNSFQKIKG